MSTSSPYDVFIRLSAVDGITGVLATIAARCAGVDREFKNLGEGMKKTLAGVGLMAGGAEILKTVWDIAKGSKELLNQQEQLGRAGVSHLDVVNLTADAYERMSKVVPTASVDEMLRTAREMRAIVGDKASMATLEATTAKALQVDALLSNTFGTEKHGEYYKLLRSAEMKGIATDEAKRTALTDAAFSYITAFGGKLTANDFQTMARRGGTAWMNAKPESIGPLAILAAELGGQTAGQTAMTLQQLQMGANTLSKQQGEVLNQAGLLDMSKVTKTGFGGGRLQVGPGGILGSLQYAGDLPGWIKNVVYPHILAAAGGDDALAQSLISKISPNRNAAKLVEMFGSPGFLDQQAKDLGLAGKVKSIDDAYKSFVDTNPTGVEAAFEAQKKSMIEAMGSPMMQAAIPIMKSITDMFTNIGGWANAHPETAAQIGKAITAIGIAIVGVGAVFVTAGIATAIGFMGPFAAGIAAIGSAIAVAGAAYALYGDQIKGVFTSIGNDMVNGIASLPGQASAAISSAFALIGKNISDAVKSVIPGFGGGSPPSAPPADGSHVGNFRAPGKQSSLMPPPKQLAFTVPVTVNLDSRKMAQVTMNHVVASATYPTSAAGADSRGTWMGPSWAPTEQG
jgi:hypothetical protein